jgi:hydroxymethylbilane synthase
MSVQALVAMPDGSRVIRDSVDGRPADAEQLGEALARRLLDQGAGEVLRLLESADA